MSQPLEAAESSTAEDESVQDREETPAREPSCLSWISQSTALADALRELVLIDTEKTVLLVTHEWLLGSVFRPVDDDSIEQIVGNLRDKSWITKMGRWKGFPHDPKSSPRNENDVFYALGPLIAAIIAEGRPFADGEPTLEYRSNPGMVPLATKRDSSTKPDGSLLIVESLYAWINIAVASEYKKNQSLEDIRDVSGLECEIDEILILPHRTCEK